MLTHTTSATEGPLCFSRPNVAVSNYCVLVDWPSGRSAESSCAETKRPTERPAAQYWRPQCSSIQCVVVAALVVIEAVVVVVFSAQCVYVCVCTFTCQSVSQSVGRPVVQLASGNVVDEGKLIIFPARD